MAQDISLDHYNYTLPDEKIAKHPLPERDQSKLLYYQQENIQHHQFFELPFLLPQNSILFFNDTKVLPARIYLQKVTGAKIEILLLHPHPEGSSIQETLFNRSAGTWKCMIGNKKKWKPEEKLFKSITVDNSKVDLAFSLTDAKRDIVQISWKTDHSFLQIIDAAGIVPLPPYLKRLAIEDDKERYQTIYSKNEGAVAAPTAGLHFTDQTFNDLKKEGTAIDYLTLHVSAGTFQPIKESQVANHPMHSEKIVVTRKNLDNLLTSKSMIAVGTTSMRTLESIYWYGVKILLLKNNEFAIPKLLPYQHSKEHLPSVKEAVEAVLNSIPSEERAIVGETEIFIFPGYEFKICNGLITNFHMPKSTLLLLIAAFIGDDWKKIYHSALLENYRFLSYGDSSLLLRNR